MTTRSPPGSMVLWRFNGEKEYRFGYCTYVESYNIIRMGRYNGDTIGGSIVDINDIEWIHRR
jgi:hypothetical protein